MKITIYELLGLIKDDKAPNKIKLRAFELKRTQSSDIHRLYVDNDGMFFPKDYNFYLHEQVEILEEEKKIPEKIGKIDDNDGYIDQDDVIKIGKKVDEIIDYLKSKGDK